MRFVGFGVVESRVWDSGLRFKTSPRGFGGPDGLPRLHVSLSWAVGK